MRITAVDCVQNKCKKITVAFIFRHPSKRIYILIKDILNCLEN